VRIYAIIKYLARAAVFFSYFNLFYDVLRDITAWNYQKDFILTWGGLNGNNCTFAAKKTLTNDKKRVT
jgi:hypothetical protein